MLLTRRSALVSLAAISAGALAACATDKNKDGGSGAGKTLSIVATTGYLGDAARNIAPDATVTVLVGPGGDPHTQELTTKDTQAIESADVVLWTSHDMEHKMLDQLDGLGAKQVPAAESIPEDMLLPWEEDGVVEGHDPHVWNSPDNWKHVVTACAGKIAEIDSANAETYKANAEAYNKKIDEAKEAAKKLFDAIPQENRVLVTGHDAFNYLGKTYGIEIHATDFVSSESELSAADIEDLATLIAEKKIKVIFQDNLKNPEAITHVKEAVAAKGGSVEVSDKPLYADSLGEAAPVDTYLGVFAYNAETISAALTGRTA
ncbi:ABC transporter component [Actinomyces sp. Chiba101]|uniref:Manganese/zinc/iron transport system substrate-binding protein n=1 Tax=Actinomyces denticolens TaxID=52767 RepID=A0ABY1IHN1_9ACTO|nr:MULTISPECIES: metal ABC transporter substrate-binding protein [Actinomyces]BAW92094.1 ABC transporter component [Actinomyces sp. Chiba101]GAV94973.1 Zn2+ ABC superfamily ATP binding cassette transporter, binding protein [Actinomyces denticolens]SHJ18911.1 manganese/zinc/iron transport system substrate-binding protein [Actinomyces denticolens]SUU11393.1 Tromp-1 [Actinomyces denticolens]